MIAKIIKEKVDLAEKNFERFIIDDDLYELVRVDLFDLLLQEWEQGEIQTIEELLFAQVELLNELCETLRSSPLNYDQKTELKHYISSLLALGAE